MPVSARHVNCSDAMFCVLGCSLTTLNNLFSLEKESASAWTESVQEHTQIKETDFRYFVLTASEPELEEVLTTYTHKNKSASVFLGASKPKSRYLTSSTVLLLLPNARLPLDAVLHISNCVVRS